MPELLPHLQVQDSGFGVQFLESDVLRVSVFFPAGVSRVYDSFPASVSRVYDSSLAGVSRVYDSSPAGVSRVYIFSSGQNRTSSCSPDQLNLYLHGFTGKVYVL